MAEKEPRASPEDAEILRALGHILARTGYHGEAAECFAAVVAKRPTDISAWHWKGEMLERLGQHAGAAEAYMQALDGNPDDIVLQESLARTLARAGAYREAAASYEKILRANPENTGAAIEKGVALLYLGDHPGAINSFDRVLARIRTTTLSTASPGARAPRPLPGGRDCYVPSTADPVTQPIPRGRSSSGSEAWGGARCFDKVASATLRYGGRYSMGWSMICSRYDRAVRL